MEVDEWKGCYPSSWRGIITPESFSHPAKASSKLAERIYKHAISEGWLHEGSRIVDPFGGIGGFAFHAMLNGMDMTLVELEPKFVALAQANIDAWNAKYSGRLARWGTARIIQGDSRHLAQVLASADGCISSPPYAANRFDGGEESLKKRQGYSPGYSKDGGYGDNTPGNLGNLAPGNLAQVIGAADACISSPPFANSLDRASMPDKFLEQARINHNRKYSQASFKDEGYGTTPGNLGNLPPGDVDACISSPPYAESMEKAGGIDPSKSVHIGGPHSQMNNSDTRYGSTPGQLAALPPGAPPFDAAISSPPFEKQQTGQGIAAHPELLYGKPATIGQQNMGYQNQGFSSGQLGNDSGETFWSAAREIVAQVYQVLAPGAHAIWVVKSYVKNKQLVDFPHQWQTLCESVGFVTLHEHHALLVRHGATSIDIDGNHHEKKTESKSFFRRLAEKNGSPRIDFETVLCMVKPGGEDGGWDGAISSPPFNETLQAAPIFENITGNLHLLNLYSA